MFVSLTIENKIEREKEDLQSSNFSKAYYHHTLITSAHDRLGASHHL